MATGNFTTTTHANFIPEVWSKNILDGLDQNLVMAKRISDVYTGEIKAFGDTVHIPGVTNFTAGDKSAGTAVTFVTNTESVTDLKIDQHKYVAFKVEDITSAQANVDLQNVYTRRAVNALAEAVDDKILTDFSASDAVTQTAGASGDDATARDTALLRAIQYLDDALAPEQGRSLVVKPSQRNLYMATQKFVDASYRGDAQNPVVSGAFTQVYGIPAFTSTNITMTGTQSDNYMFHRDVATLAIQKDIRVQADYALADLAWEVVADMIFGHKVVRPTFGVWLKGA